MISMKIGYTGNNYPEKRNIVGRVAEVEYVNVNKYNAFAYINKFNFWWKKRAGKDLIKSDYYQFKSLLKPSVNGIHFFNSVSYSSTPYITTFETVLPYFDVLKKDFKHTDDWSQLMVEQHILEAMEALASENCKGVLALSNSTKKIQEIVLAHYPQYASKILNKLSILHPPQEAVNYHARSFGGVFQLVFVGRAFYRKGGQELIHALTKIQKEIPIHLHLISSLDLESGWPGITNVQVAEDKKWLKDQSWISFHEAMPNAHLLTLFGQCHLGFLPTWQDTYGYSVLEMQSRGCPVVSTMIRSLPEINPIDVGWQIEHPVNQWGEWRELPTSRESELSESLANEIYSCVKEILANPQALETKGRASVARIQKEHSPERHSQILSDLYQRMFGKK
jgi:glycosyltransferase involved in cell wall biosynthesis